MMKVAYLLGSLNRGGTETLMLDVFRNADKASYSFIGIHRKGGACKDEFYAAGSTMYQLAPKRFGYLRYFIRLRNLLKTESITIVHTQHWLDCLYASIATTGMPVQIVNTFHGFYSMKGLNGLLCRMSIRMADDVCFVSRYEQEWYQRQMRIPDKKCHVIFNGIDLSKIELANDGVRELEKDRRARLCMVGNFMSGRDHRTLIHALRLLKERGINNFEFYFIGRRSEAEPYIYDECVRVCEENKMKHVHFMGGRSDVPELLKTMDGFVYSTDHDTFGIAVVEAMAAGLPIVVNDWPVMKEVCGDMASYFRSKDVEDCADAIEKLLAELSQRKEAAKKIAAIVRKKYSIVAYIARLNAVYGV